MRPSLLSGKIFALFLSLSLNAPIHAGSVENDIIDTLVPTRIYVTDQGQEVIQYAVPCGGSFTGLFASPGRRGVRIAAVVRRSEMICTGMPQFQSIMREAVGLKKGVNITEFTSNNWKSRLVRPSLIDIRRTRRQSGENLQLVHESNCGKIKGLFIRIENGSSVEVGVGELASASGGDCPYRQEIMPVDFVNLEEFRSVAPIMENQGELEDLFRIKMAYMPLQSVRALPSGGTALTYMKACNQELLGIAVSGSISRSEQFSPRLASKAKFGVVVAEFYNRGCKPGAPKTSWEVVQAPFLKRPAMVRGFEEHDVGGDELVIKSPVSFDSGRSGRGMGLNFYGGCNNEFAAIYSLTGKRSLMVGILARRTEDLCGSKVAQRTMHQPLFSHGADKGRIYPLRINSL